MYVWNLLPDMTNDQNRLERVKDIAAKAKAIDPGTAEAHAALSVSHFLERDWKGAEREIQEAIRLNPNLAIARDLYSFYLTILERFPEAHREAEAAEELQGLRPDARRVTAIVAAFPYMGERRLDGAISQLKRVLDQDDRFGYGHQFLGWCYEWQSNYLDAIEEYRKAALLLGGDPKAVNTGFDTLRQAYNDGGEQGYLRKSIEMIHARENLPDDQQLLDVLDLPGYHARLGEKEKAIEELEKHFDEPQVWHQVRFIATHESLRDDPRFKALVKRAGLKP
jgi:tetratricopeptide (TPR) repeat protein